jgi:predicted transcriptional regulator of viral defense system
METYTTTEIIRLLKDREISLFSLSDFSRLFNIRNDLTLYKKIARLEQKKIVKKLIKGKYFFALNPPNDFAIANYLYQPSYISLESALSFYGIITGFPYKITSISTKKSRLFNTDQKEFQYSQIAADLFWGYEKRENFLLADKEKALLDYLYFFSKGIKSFDREEFDLQEINQKKLISYARSFKIAKWLTIIKEYL